MMTRSFGDRTGHSIGLISIPEIIEYKRDQSDVGICVGSDGLWDNLNEEEYLQAISNSLSSHDAEHISSSVVETALSCWHKSSNSNQGASYVDDITCLFALFN